MSQNKNVIKKMKNSLLVAGGGVFILVIDTVARYGFDKIYSKGGVPIRVWGLILLGVGVVMCIYDVIKMKKKDQE